MGVSSTLSLGDLGAVEEPPRERLDRVVRLAGRLFDAPLVAVNLLDDEYQYTILSVGGEEGRIPRRESICGAVADTGLPLVIRDAHEDPRFRDHPAVRLHPRLRSYAGAPLKVRGGQTIGALCVADDRPRVFGDDDVRLLMDLAAWLEKEFSLGRDLEQAAEVQRHLLPRRAPDVPGLEAAGRCVSAREVGGDLFDWQVVDGCLQVSLIDAMGKGIPGALIAAQVRATMRGATRLHPDLAGTIAYTDSAVEEDLEETERFVTLFAARIDPRDATVQYVDAGHNLTVIASANRPPRRLTSTCLPLGIVPDETWDLATDRLADDEFLLAVSDGILDVFPDDTTALEALSALAREDLGPHDVVDRIIAFATEHESTDDLTAVVVRRRRTGGST